MPGIIPGRIVTHIGNVLPVNEPGTRFFLSLKPVHTNTQCFPHVCTHAHMHVCRYMDVRSIRTSMNSCKGAHIQASSGYRAKISRQRCLCLHVMHNNDKQTQTQWTERQSSRRRVPCTTAEPLSWRGTQLHTKTQPINTMSCRLDKL